MLARVGVRLVVSGAIALAAMVLMIVGGWGIPILSFPAVVPGGILAMIVLYLLNALVPLPGRIVLEGGDDDVRPALFASASVILSFLIWWAVTFAVLTHRYRRKLSQ